MGLDERGSQMRKIFALIVVCALLVLAFGTAFKMQAKSETTAQVAIQQGKELAKLQAEYKSVQEQLDAQSERADALQEEIVKQDDQLYQLNLVANPKQLLVNFDDAMKDYEDRLTGKDAQGYAYGNLGDNVIPMLYDMVEGRDLPRKAIETRINRLAKYVVSAENIGDNEGEDTETLNAIKDLQKKLKSF